MVKLFYFMKKALFLILVFLSVVVLFLRYGVGPFTKLLGVKMRAGIKITSIPKAQVFLNGKEMSMTPFQDENLTPGEFRVKLVADSGSWEGQVKIRAGTMAVVNRELGETIASSAGEILTLSDGKGVGVVSYPNSSEVEIDGKVYGKSPLSIQSISGGEHMVLVSHDGFLKRNTKVVVLDKLKLNLNVDLAIVEADLSVVGALVQTASQSVIVKPTPTGYLRVREKPDLSSVEIDRVLPGDSLTLLEETVDWVKVRLANGKEGYVSSNYVEKKNQ